MAPLSVFDFVGRLYQLVSYGFAAAAVAIFSVCYLSLNPLSGLGLSGFRLGLTLFLLFAGAAVIISWVAVIRFSDDTDDSDASERLLDWGWAWESSPSVTPEGERMRLVAVSLLILGFLAMIVATVVGP